MEIRREWASLRKHTECRCHDEVNGDQGRKISMTEALYETHLPGKEPLSRGKVRDIYDLGENLLIVATDRISAFDWVNPVGIPDKGKILTQMSLYWFEVTRDICRNHLISSDLRDYPEEFQAHPEQFEGRSMLVRKCEMFPVEFVVRGYLAGSGWKEYRNEGRVCGIPLPQGLQESSRLDEPLFTPATKASDGHDINIPPEKAGEIIGKEWAEAAAAKAIELYRYARGVAESKGIILCDTKFEFGLHEGELMLADEVLTPDSSRYWPADHYEPGRSQPSYDKQFVRDWLESTGWDKESPPPALPEDVIAKTREKYVEAYKRLTGRNDF
jgi:phosphoribosylaminoimidazole-succinocarboxamide synthase